MSDRQHFATNTAEDQKEWRDAISSVNPNRAKPPEHYAGSIEPWDYWAAHNLDPWEANVVKYVTRAGRKETSSALTDYKKAKAYIEYLIRREEAK
ncbi:DUF3310 domain-containing protein [Streptomyces sp. NPDC055085]